jgi:hypothetical protein
MVSFTDTADNWAATVEHCANIKTGESGTGTNTITKTYAVWISSIGMNTVSFYRRGSMTKPTPHGVGLYAEGAFSLATDAPCFTCHSDPACIAQPNTNDETADNNAAAQHATNA